MCPVPKAVYVREDKLYFDCCSWIGGDSLSRMSSVDVVYLNPIEPWIRIRTTDGTAIVFTAATQVEADTFVHQLRSAVKAAKTRYGPTGSEF